MSEGLSYRIPECSPAETIGGCLACRATGSRGHPSSSGCPDTVWPDFRTTCTARKLIGISASGLTSDSARNFRPRRRPISVRSGPRLPPSFQYCGTFRIRFFDTPAVRPQDPLGFFQQPLRAEALDERDELPDFFVGRAHGTHLASGNSEPDRRVQLGIAAASAVNPRRQIGAAAAFTGRSVAVGAVSLEEGSALLNVGFRRKRIGFGICEAIARASRP